MLMNSTSKSTIISQQYGLLMAQQSGLEAPSADAWRNLASLAVLRMHELEQELRISANPVEASGNLIGLALSRVNEPLTATESALLRYGETCTATPTAERELTDLQQRSHHANTRQVEPSALPFNAYFNSQCRATNEKRAKERSRMIKDGTYSDVRERELLQKYARKTPRQGGVAQELKPTK
ncbi:hypothetical protein QRT53_003064 [Salmonella enterica]|nr:hypothetical protein [Salmonella enterica]